MSDTDRARPSAAAPSPFPAIADYAFLSDCHTGALVAPDGSVEWLCLPAFDGPSVFGALLDRGGGTFRFAPHAVTHPTARAYEPGTNVMTTTWKTPTGWARVREALTLHPTSEGACSIAHVRPPADWDADHALVRTVECLRGHVDLELICEPVFDYGRTPGEWRLVGDGRHVAEATGAGASIQLASDLQLGIEGPSVRARHRLHAGERAYSALSWASEPRLPADADAARTSLDGTADFWLGWLEGARIPDHRWAQALQRSALTIKGLTYMPTGATVAALTTSLPETPGGERNWDYRYTWMRDTSFTLQALHWLNMDQEADDFVEFIADVEPDADGSLQVMYGIDGRRELPEVTIDELSGYAGARPVRVGNAAYAQKQNDVYGAVLDAILLQARHSGHMPRRLWPIVVAQAERAASVWREPDQGIWEARGEPRHYVSSKIMCWVALDRAAALAHTHGDAAQEATWRAMADEIRADVLSHGVTAEGVLRQHYDTDSLDASTLLAACFHFLERDDPRLRATVDAIDRDLTDRGFVLRYRTDETDDGMSGTEGSFLICSFWLVSALSYIGESQRAQDMMSRLLRIASPLGHFAEEFDPATGQHLGNVPQAFSHLALIEAAGRIMFQELRDSLA